MTLVAIACEQPAGPAATPPTIALSSAALNFTGVAGGANPASQNVTITNTGGSTLAWSATVNQGWIGLAPTSGTGTALTVSINTAGLTAGSYSATITISSGTATNSPQSISVTLTLEPPATIGVSTTAMSFSGTAGGASPATQILGIANTGGGTLSWTANDDQTWLSLSPGSGTAPSNVTVAVNTTGLAVGTYNGAITVTAPGAPNTPRTVAVTLVLAAPPTIGLSTSALNFSGVAGGVNPASQAVTISNTGGSTLSWTAGVNQGWVGLAPTSGSGTALTVSVNTVGLTAGNYAATITIASPTATNSPQTINVTLTLDPPATIGVSTTAMTFSGMVGGAPPATQILGITNTGGGTLSWTASDDQTWLSLSAGTGAAPSNVTVTANTAGLAVGTYNGTITVTAPGATNTPRTVTVTLTVTPDLSGVWVGTTSQDSTLRITVVNNAVTQIYMGFRIPACGVTGATTTTFTTPFSIASGTINRTVSGTPIGWTITGTFVGGTTASGNLTITWSLSGCSSTVNLTWTAVKT